MKPENSHLPWLGEPLWILSALHELGTRSTAPRVAEYLTACDGKPGDDWCAAFVAWCLRRAGIDGTGKRAARSYQRWGIPTPADEHLGSIVVLWREAPVSSWKGHVGFLLEQDARRVRLVGGNQGGVVSIRWYPKARVLTQRWPTRA